MNDQDTTTKVDFVLNHLKIKNPVLLGKGGEGWVYEYGNDALKIYPRTADKEYLIHTQTFQRALAKQHFTFDIPQIYTVGEIDGILYTIEKRLHGAQMDKKIIGRSTSDRQRMYLNYYEAIRQVNAVTFSDVPYGQIINTSESITSDSWVGYLLGVLEHKMLKISRTTRLAVIDIDMKLELFMSLVKRYLVSTEKNLVHCDYFLNNVLVNDDLSISAVLDFSVHAAVGDPKLDIAGVLTWNEIDPNITREDYFFLYDIARKDYGNDIEKYADLYLLFSSFYFLDMDDPSFSIKNLNTDTLWKKYR